MPAIFHAGKIPVCYGEGPSGLRGPELKKRTCVILSKETNPKEERDQRMPVCRLYPYRHPRRRSTNLCRSYPASYSCPIGHSIHNQIGFVAVSDGIDFLSNALETVVKVRVG